MSETDFSASHDPSPSGSLSPSNDAPKPGQGISYSGLPSQKAPAHFTCADCGEISIRFTANKRFCSACVRIRSRAQSKAYDLRTRKSKPREIVWTDERKQEALKLKTDGHSSSVIAKHFGVTRNAVIGLMHRMGLSQPRKKYTAADYEASRLAKAQRARERQRERRQANPYIHREANKRWREANKDKLRARRKAYVPLTPGERQLSVVLPTYAESLNVPFTENRGCKFMAGGPDDKLCCGLPKQAESSYCAHHHKVCHAE